MIIARKFFINSAAGFAMLVVSVVGISILSSEMVAQGTTQVNGKIAFVSDRDGNREIYVMNSDGTKQKRITNNAIVDEHPSWSPDGKKIAFISQRQTGEYAIFQMLADGTGKTEITPVDFRSSPSYADGWTISWSPNGRQLTFRDGAGGGNIYVVNSDGSGRRYLANGFGPAWSPDSSKILFITGGIQGEIHTINPDGTDLKTLPSLPDNYNWYYDVTWSPTGSEIAITAFDGANEVIFITDAYGSGARYFDAQCAPTPLGCSRLAGPAWSPDGRTIAFLVWGPQSGMEIYAKDITGWTRRLTDTNGDNRDPSWQPLNILPVPSDPDGEAR